MHHHTSAKSQKPNYALIPERLLWHIGVIGSVEIAAGFAISLFLPAVQPTVPSVLILVGVLHLFPLALLLFILRIDRRLNARDRIMNAVAWRGDEQVLDVGCGNGILLLAAAGQLKTGRAWGIDIWDHAAGRQTADMLRHNAQIEGVADRVELREVDARKMPFEDGSFDVIFASLSLHHTGNRAAREQVVKEMARVLKPNGRMLLYDVFPVIGGAKHDLRQLGINRIQRLNGHLIQTVRADKQPSQID